MQVNKLLPSTFYHQAIFSRQIQPNEEQQALLVLLDELSVALQRAACPSGVFDRLKKRFVGKHLYKGIYIWGEVGRGKTLLMDWFYESLSFESKLRLHFYRFMQRVHQQLQLSQKQGIKNPLQKIARQFAKNYHVICLDEFAVTDVTDAMILGELLQQLYLNKVTLLFTSNTEPNALYRNGVQRERFLPAISAIKQEAHVWELGGELDFRLRTLSQAGLYYSPLDESAEHMLSQTYLQLSKQTCYEAVTLTLNDRIFEAISCHEDVIWFNYPELCVKARGQYDYIELARQFHTVFISHIPVFTADRDDEARRFISLVDEFYDRNVKLVLSAAADIAHLYQGRLLKPIFVRTESRLIEMQSHAYLAKGHLA